MTCTMSDRCQQHRCTHCCTLAACEALLHGHGPVRGSILMEVLRQWNMKLLHLLDLQHTFAREWAPQPKPRTRTMGLLET